MRAKRLAPRWKAGRIVCACFALLIADSALGSLAGAQVSGRVLGADRRPVNGAELKVVDELRVLASARTDQLGRFRIPLRVESPSAALDVRADGYARTRIPLVPGDTVFTIQLRSTTIALAPVIARIAPVPCGWRDETSAREAWNAASARVPRGVDSLSFLVHFTSTFRRISTDSAGHVSVDSVFGPGSRPSSSWVRRGWRIEVARGGYARRLGGSVSDEFGPWEYPRLWGESASLLLEPDFGRRHKMQVVSHDSTATVVRFCPRNRDAPGVRGTLRIANGQVSRADWQFVTSRPEEVAGGWATFMDSPGAPPLLLPEQSFYYRRMSDGRIYEERYRYREWVRYSEDSPARRH